MWSRRQFAEGRKVTGLVEATEQAIKAAKHLTDMDAGAVEALRALALKIDMQDDYFQALAEHNEERKLRPPSQDNVSIPTYLKYAEALGLTPNGRTKAEIEAPKGAGPSGTLGKLQGLKGGKSA
ncbi:MAG: terminase small subunit [Mycobacteriaceae bacterium]